jgi:colicin import membrane protein
MPTQPSEEKGSVRKRKDATSERCSPKKQRKTNPRVEKLEKDRAKKAAVKAAEEKPEEEEKEAKKAADKAAAEKAAAEKAAAEEEKKKAAAEKKKKAAECVHWRSLLHDWFVQEQQSADSLRAGY